jgi:hypothetical protein
MPIGMKINVAAGDFVAVFYEAILLKNFEKKN